MKVSDTVKHLLTVFITCFLVLYFCFPHFSTFPPSLDNLPTALLPFSLILEGNFDFNEFKEGQAKLVTLGTDDDQYYFFNLNNRGEVVANYPMFPGVLLTPFYFMRALINPDFITIRTFESQELWEFNFFVSVLLTSLNAAVVFKLLHLKSKKVSIAAVLTFAFVFATAVVHTSAKFPWQHTFALLFLSLILYAYETKRLGSTVLFSTLVFLCRPPAVLLCIPFLVKLGMSVLKGDTKNKVKLTKTAILLILLSIGLVALQFIYAHRYLDSSTVFAFQYNATRFNGFFWNGFLGLLISPSRGLLFFTPLFIYSFIYYFSPSTLKKSPEYALSILLFIGLMSKWLMWIGGWSLGYRLLIELVPILILGLVPTFAKFKPSYSLPTILVVLAFAASVLINTQILANFGDCGFNAQPESVDMLPLPYTSARLWQDSPLLRCFEQFQRMY